MQPPYKLLLLISYPQGGSQFVGKMVTFRDRSSFCILSKATLNKSQPFYETTFLLLLLPGFYELTRLIYLCSCRNCLTRIYILQIIMQARGHYSKLNFTFLRFPLSQRSISLQNDIGWTSSCTLSFVVSTYMYYLGSCCVDWPVRLPFL